MRILIIAAMTACLSGAAWAGVEHETPRTYACESYGGGDAIDSEALSDTIEAALEGALGALEHADLDETTLAHVEAEIEAAMANVEGELAHYEGRRSLSEAEEEALGARIEVAIERAEAAIERAVERIEDAHDRHDGDKAKIWRPRY
jgi:hypothetical protein